MNLSRKLAKQAKAKGICQEWHDQLRELDNKDAMIDMYLRGIDFCLANDYPNNDFIRANFKGFMEHKGVFLDDNINVENKPKCVCLGATCGCVAVKDFEVCEIFVKHQSKITVEAKDNAFVVIDIFDDAIVDIHAHDRAKVCVNHYGGTITQNATGNSVVKIREKNKKTY